MSETKSSSAFQPGELIAGKYKVARMLGEGGMGMVFEAHHEDLDRRVAIKVVRHELAENEQIVARLMIEARSAAKIKSEHVAKVLDVGRLDSGIPYIVMEYLEGSDLGQLSETRGPLPIHEAVDYVIQACEAIAEAHASNIIHRDLKPENLFLTRRTDGSPLVKVLDFGISKDTRQAKSGAGLTNPSSALGSPMYMSPEQMQAAPDIDVRTDIYALGAILFELLAARGVFLGDTIPAVCAQVLGSPPPPLRSLRAEIPLELDQIVLRCLEKDRNKRYSDVGALVSALLPFAGAHGRVSATRVLRVVRGGAGADTGLAETLNVPPPSPAGTQPAFVASTGASSTPKKPSRALYTALGVLAASGVGLLGVKIIGGGAPMAPEPRASSPLVEPPPAEVRSTAAAPDVTPVVAPSTPKSDAPGSEARTETKPSPAADAGAEPVADAGTPGARTRTPDPVRRAPASRPERPSSKGAGVDAFDPSSFGDRH